MTHPSKKRVGLNPKQIAVMEQIRHLSDADVAKGARIVKKKLGLKACYPVLDTSLDHDLFLPEDIIRKGWSEHTVRRYTAYFLGIAKKKDESNRDARLRFEESPHPFAPLVFGNDGKPQSQWAGVKLGAKPPVRLVSERLLLFMVLGLAIVKGDTKAKDAKNAARAALWKGLGIQPATVVPISDDDECAFWTSVTTPVADPTVVEEAPTQASLAFPGASDVDIALESFGSSPINGSNPLPSADDVEAFLAGMDSEDSEDNLPSGAEDLILQGLQMLQQGVHLLLEETRTMRADRARSDEDVKALAAQKKALEARAASLDAREKAMRDKEAVLAQVLRVTEGLRGRA